MLNEEEWKELASKKLELEYENQVKVGRLLDIITIYMNNEIDNQKVYVKE